MRPRGREVEKRVGSAQCAIKRIRVLFSGAKDTKLEKHKKSGLKIPQEKRTGPQSEEESSCLTFDFGVKHNHLGQTRTAGENSDVTCKKNLIYKNSNRCEPFVEVAWILSGNFRLRKRTGPQSE
jgi:hypothetical protein